jgi:glycosyltransferase involved in cell wall biosynthesis
MESVMSRLAVVVPTRNRPEQLKRCLSALARARDLLPFEAYVCDSSDAPVVREAVREVCEGFEFVAYFRHSGKNAGAARNFCTRVAAGEILVSVDDDVYVEPDAILRLLEAYKRGKGWRVVAGSVAWPKDDWSEPVVMRPIGYGRRVCPGESADFIVTALFLYPRALALACPWNDRIRWRDDIFVGALWRSKGVTMMFESRARAFHDEQLNTSTGEEQGDQIYVNLFDALLANPNAVRVLAYEFLGFLAGAKFYFRHPKTAWIYVTAWGNGHRRLIRDWQYLKHLVRKPLPHG